MSLAAVIHKSKRNAAGNSEKVVQPWVMCLIYQQSKWLLFCNKALMI